MDKTIKNRLDLFRMFLSPVRIENQYTKNQSNNNPRKEYKKQFIHSAYLLRWFRMGRFALNSVKNEKDNGYYCHNSRTDKYVSSRHIHSSYGYFFAFSDLFSVLCRIGRGMFFFPVGVEDKASYNQSKDAKHYKQNGDFIHSSSPLSTVYPPNAKIKNTIRPIVKLSREIFSWVINLLITIVAKIICAKLNINLDKFSLRRFVSFITNILHQIKTIVNPVRSNPARRNADAQSHRTSNGVKKSFDKIKILDAGLQSRLSGWHFVAGGKFFGK